MLGAKRGRGEVVRHSDFKRGRNLALFFLAIALVLLLSMKCMAAGPAEVIIQSNASQKIKLIVGKSIIMRTQKPLSRVSLATPEIADYVLLSPNQLYITGKAPGITNMTMWESEDKILAIYDLEVAPDVSLLKEKLYQILPGEEGLRVLGTHDSITLAGKISSTANLSQALSLAQSYAPGGKVINLLEVGGVHQVMLEVRVAEMSRSLAKTLGVNLVVTNEGSLGTSLIGNLTSISSFSGGPDAGSLDLDISETVNSLVHIAGGTWSLTTFIDALQDDGLVSILAEPTLVTLSGQTANFWAGGEFPVPVPQGLGTVGIEFKQFGVLLSFTPTVLSDQRINMQVTPPPITATTWFRK